MARWRPLPYGDPARRRKAIEEGRRARNIARRRAEEEAKREEAEPEPENA